MEYDIVIIGAGISGCVLAERYANILNKKVLLIEKRNHIGGNCYDYFDKEGILVPKYGPHFFHTNHKKVWDYVSKFTSWIPYEHRVLSFVDKKLVPIPVNITTINTLFNLSIKNTEEMKQWLKKNTPSIKHPKNSEEIALQRVGNDLYKKLFYGYTTKQWGTNPKNLDSSIVGRIPVRYSFDDRYFNDYYQAMPKQYTKLFNNMLKNKKITIKLNTDYFSYRKEIGEYKKLFFTGSIDNYFQYSFGNLEYRSLRFKYITLPQEYYQTKAQINYPNIHLYTRITEPKHATKQKHPHTIIIKEYPADTGDPYYPVLNNINKRLYKKYHRYALQQKIKNVYFIGRLANFRYINMDLAFHNAIELFSKLEK
jgi:UDP-galactopyranose mutase